MSELKDSLAALTGDLVQIAALAGTVVAVDEEQDTCDVQPLNDDALLYDVQLLGGIYPAVGSPVLVGFVENRRTDAFLISADQISHYKLTTEQESLHALLTDLIKAIRAMVFTTNAGPTVKLVTDPQFAALAGRIDSLLLP